MAGIVDRIQVVVSASTGGAVSEFNRLESSAKKTQGAADRMGKSFGIAGSTLKAGLVAGAAALVGTGLIRFLNDSVDAYGDAAKAAGDLAHATGSSVETVSRLTAAMEDAGVSAETTAGLLTKFTTNIGKNKDALDQLGVSLVRNKDGSVDYAATMVKVVDAIGEIGDASQRNALLVQFFGKAGAKAFQDLYNSGMKLSDAMALVSKYRVFTAEDIKRAAAYDDAMDKLAASTQGLQFALGRALIPALSAVAGVLATTVDAFSAVIDILDVFPADVYLVAGAVIFLARAIKTELIAGALASMGAALVNFGFNIAAIGVLAVNSARSVGILNAAMLGLRAGITAVGTALAANPIGLAITVAVAAYAALRYAMTQADKAAERNLVTLNELEKQGMSTADAVDQLSSEMVANASTWEKLGFAIKDLSGWEVLLMGPLTFLADSLFGTDDAARGAAKALTELRENQGEYAYQTELAKSATDELNRVIAEMLSASDMYSVSLNDIADAARNANEAQFETNRMTNAAKLAMEEYAYSIEQVMDATDRLAEATKGIEGGLNDMQDAVEAFNKGDDLATWGNEQVIALQDFTTKLDATVRDMFESGMTAEQVIASLKDRLGSLPPELRKIVEGMIADLESHPSEWDITIVPMIDFADPQVKAVTAKYDLRDPTQFKKWLDETYAVSTGTAVELEQNVTVNTTFEVDEESKAETEGEIAALGQDAVAKVTVDSETQAAEDAIDRVTKDRTALIHVESRNGPATREYITSIATQERLALIRIESRNGPAVKSYIDSIGAGDHLALIRVESRNGPAVDAYIDGIAHQDRNAYIDVVVRGVSAARRTLNDLARSQAAPTVPVGAAQTATRAAPVYVTNNLRVDGAIDTVGTARTIEAIMRANDARMRGQATFLGDGNRAAFLS